MLTDKEKEKFFNSWLDTTTRKVEKANGDFEESGAVPKEECDPFSFLDE